MKVKVVKNFKEKGKTKSLKNLRTISLLKFLSKRHMTLTCKFKNYLKPVLLKSSVNFKNMNKNLVDPELITIVISTNQCLLRKGDKIRWA